MDDRAATDRERGAAAIAATRKAYAAGHVLIVHYECGKISEGEAVPVHAIAVKDPATNTTEIFLARGGEAESLASFAKFARSRNDYCWLHWNMRNAAYGFEHLQERISQLCRDESLAIPKDRPDLGLVCWQVCGNMPHGNSGKLHGLCKANDITTDGALSPVNVQSKVEAGQWAAVKASALRKVEMVQAVWCRMLDGTLLAVAEETGQHTDAALWSRVLSQAKAARLLRVTPRTIKARVKANPSACEQINRQLFRFDRRDALFRKLPSDSDIAVK